MSNLVILVLVLALSLLLVALAQNYIAESYEQSQINARAATLVSEAQQVNGAALMFGTDHPGQKLSDMQDLVPVYLTSLPPSWMLGEEGAADVAPNHFVRPMDSSERNQQKICEVTNQKLGIPPPVPTCPEISPDFTGCCMIEAPDAAP